MVTTLAHQTADRLLASGEELQRASALLGFNGLIGAIYHVVDTRQPAGHYTRVKTIEAFGRRIVAGTPPVECRYG